MRWTPSCAQQQQQESSRFRGEGDWLQPAVRLSRARGPQVLASPLFPGLALGLEQVFE